MLNYEVTFIADPVLSGDEIKKTVQAYSDMITKEGCTITHTDNMGLRQLTYPINKKNSGIYHCIEFQTESGAMLAQMELALRRDERIMRFLTVRLDKYGVKYNADKRAGKIGKSKKTVEREEEKKKEAAKEIQVPKNADKPISLPPTTPTPAKAEPTKAEAAPVEAVAAAAAPVVEAAAPVVEKTTVTVKSTGDSVDLTKIEGIGPKAAEVLMAAGVVSYTHLKLKSADEIKTILAEGNSSLAHLDPTTWPKQAEYAANGEWDALKKWQDELDGGKAASSEEE